MFGKIKKIIQEDLQRRYEQLEERFMVFEQGLYGHLADRLDGLEQQLDHIGEILRKKAKNTEAPENDDENEVENIVDQKIEDRSNSKKTSELKQDNLQDLPGLGNSLDKKLQNEGIISFKQLANLSDEDLDQLNAKIPGLKIRYERYEWKREAAKKREQ